MYRWYRRWLASDAATCYWFVHESTRTAELRGRRPADPQERRAARPVREQARQTRDAARHPAARLPELRADPRTDPRRRDRRFEDCARMGRTAVAAPRLSGGRGYGAFVSTLRAVDRAVAVPSL